MKKEIISRVQRMNQCWTIECSEQVLSKMNILIFTKISETQNPSLKIKYFTPDIERVKEKA